MKKLSKVFAILIVITLAFLLRPINFAFNQNISENRILIEYDIFGCGSTVIKVLDGGELIVAPLKKECPTIATNEITFTDDSNTPGSALDIYDPAQIRGISYIVTGEAIGITNGAPDCCEIGAYAYNEFVPLFKANNWYYSTYIPYVFDGDFTIIGIALGVFAISFVGIIICGVWGLINKIINRKA